MYSLLGLSMSFFIKFGSVKKDNRSLCIVIYLFKRLK